MNQKVLSAINWTAATYLISSGLQLLSNLILTRLLFPEAFGLMAIINVFLIGLSLLSDLGLRSSIVQSSRNMDDAFLNTVWSISIVRGLILASIGIALAYPIALLYDQPVLFLMIAFCSVRAILEGLISPEAYIAERELQLRKFAVWQIGSQTIATISIVSLAVLLKSVWALAIGSVIGSVCILVLSHILFPRSYKFKIEMEVFWDVFTFGKWILLATAMTFLGGQGVRLVEGRLVDPEVFGLIYIAALLVKVVETGFERIASQVLFPYLSIKHRRVKEDFSQPFERARTLLVLPTFTLLCVLSYYSDLIVSILYDPRFRTAGTYMQILSLSAAITLLYSTYPAALLARGKSKYHAYLMSWRAFITVAALIVGFEIGGVEAMLWGHCIAGIIVYIICLFLVKSENVITLKLDLLCIFGLICFYLINF